MFSLEEIVSHIEENIKNKVKWKWMSFSTLLYSVQFLEFIISIDVPSYILEAS